MIEYKINNYADRERVVVGLANSGYLVKVIKKPRPNKYLEEDYYVQVEEDTDIQPIVVKTDHLSVEEQKELAQSLSKIFAEKMSKFNLLNGM